MTNNITYIPQRLKSAAKNGFVTGTIDIIDDEKMKDQQTINQETDEHLGAHDIDIADRYTKEEVNNIVSRTPETDVIVINVPAASQSDIAAWLDANTPSGTDPETGRSVRANKLYRVPGPTNTTFSEWAWDGTAYILLANKDYGIDEEPDPNSDNMAKSSGIVKAAKFYAKNAYILKNTVISKNAQPSGQPDTGIRISVHVLPFRFLIYPMFFRVLSESAVLTVKDNVTLESSFTFESKSLNITPFAQLSGAR